ncbi:hypothetical protein BB560_002483 [Smittium megazygosporum]|uniref:Ribosome biogenesis protein SLX9 n=1 Tax=Smittium megazygosporum TaxID=133381 RepID=A0A2T9ZEM3_9FUNG|nr:hypothetical protein BB560_002481 [Smittium megazygosporum]PVV03053.1 hypothetical protein BB560_002483 [Smittium megazygosporum]
MPKVKRTKTKFHSSALSASSVNTPEGRDLHLLLNYGRKPKDASSLSSKTEKLVPNKQEKDKWAKAARLVARLGNPEAKDISSAPVLLENKPKNKVANNKIKKRIEIEDQLSGLSKQERIKQKKAMWLKDVITSNKKLNTEMKNLTKKNTKKEKPGFKLNDINSVLGEIISNSSIEKTKTKSKSKNQNLEKKERLNPKYLESIKGKKSLKQKNKAYGNEIIRFGKVLNNTEFKSNPLKTIKEHLQNSL